MRRTLLVVSVLFVALLTVTPAVSPQSTIASVPLAITQPSGNVPSLFGPGSLSAASDAGVMMVVGSCLLVLGTIVRKSTRE